MNIFMNDFNIYSENKTALFLCRGDLGSTPMRLDGTSNLFSPFIYINAIFLPRRARGKHRKNSKNSPTPSNPPLFLLNASAENSGFILPRYARDKNKSKFETAKLEDDFDSQQKEFKLLPCVCVCVFCLKRNTGEADDLRGPSFSIPGKHPVFVACQFFN
jgi:hypothetical protein